MPYQTQTPIPSDVARHTSYRVKTPPLNYVQITAANGSALGSINTKPQNYFAMFAVKAWTNYDNVAPVVSTANSVATLGRPFAPNNFSVQLDRGNANKYSNTPIPQALFCSAGYRGGIVVPSPVVYGPRMSINFTFQDLTGLFLLTLTSGGTAVPLQIKMDLEGYDVPIANWQKFCLLFPEFNFVFGAQPLIAAQ